MKTSIQALVKGALEHGTSLRNAAAQKPGQPKESTASPTPAEAPRDESGESARDHKTLGAAHHVPGESMGDDEFSLRDVVAAHRVQSTPKNTEKLQLPQLSTSSKDFPKLRSRANC